MKTLLVNIVIFYVLLLMSGCSTHYSKAKEFYDNEQYEASISEYKQMIPIARNNNKLLMGIYNNIADSYSNLDNYEMAVEYYHMSINVLPRRGYYGYSNLAGLNYTWGNIKEAYDNSLKALQLTNTKYYTEYETWSSYKTDSVKLFIDSQVNFYGLKLKYNTMLDEYSSKNYKNVTNIAKQILNAPYVAYIGVSFAGTTVCNVAKGSLADINGIVKGDVILSINGKDISSAVDAYDNAALLIYKYGTNAYVKILRDGREIVIKLQLEYPEIEHTKKILNTIATNKKNRVVNLSSLLKQNNTFNGTDRNTYDHKVAVVIGVSKYKIHNPLEYATNDAKAVGLKLSKMGFKVIELYDDEATRGRILRVLADDLPGIMGKNDALVVYFAGHGITEELNGVERGGEEGYLAPVDFDKSNYTGTAISMTSIRSLVKKYRAKHILFVFDSCYSGLGLARGGGREGAFISNALKKRTAQIITAGGKSELALEDRGHGLFTRAFLETLDGKTIPIKNGYLVASDIAQAVRKTVTEKSSGTQNPAYGWLSGEGDFVFETSF